MKIRVRYEKYDRRGGDNRSIMINGDSLRSCLLTVFANLQLYSDVESILDYEINEIGRKLSDDELLENLTDASGDDADYIYSIPNIDWSKDRDYEHLTYEQLLAIMKEELK